MSHCEHIIHLVSGSNRCHTVNTSHTFYQVVNMSNMLCHTMNASQSSHQMVDTTQKLCHTKNTPCSLHVNVPRTCHTVSKPHRLHQKVKCHNLCHAIHRPFSLSETVKTVIHVMPYSERIIHTVNTSHNSCQIAKMSYML